MRAHRRHRRRGEGSNHPPPAGRGGRGLLILTLPVAFLLILCGPGALASGGPARSPLGGVSIQRDRYVEVWNCSHQSSATPVLRRGTEKGGWQAEAEARACSAARGGPTRDSYSLAAGVVQLAVPVALSSSSRGVSFGWNLSVSAATQATYGTVVGGCPFSRNSTTVANASGSFTYGSEFQWCDVLAVVNVVASVEVVDLTTGSTYLPAHAWTGLHLTSGQQTITYGWFGNYSNRTDWGQNYTVWQSENYTFSTSSSISGTFAPRWFVNGTFNGSDRYELRAVLNSSVAVESYQYNRGRASASFDGLRGSTRYEEPGRPVVY